MCLDSVEFKSERDLRSLGGWVVLELHNMITASSPNSVLLFLSD